MTGQDLRQARLNKEWTQWDAAKSLGVSQGYISLLEKDRRPIPAKLVSKLLQVLELSPTALPLNPAEKFTSAGATQGFAEYLGAFGYPGFSHLRGRPDRNPTDVLFDALMERDLDSRVAEGLPWLALKFTEMNWDWLVKNAKLHDLQNRLGFVVTLARKVAERTKAETKATVLAQYEALLESARLVREDTFCHDSLTNAERHWLTTNRPSEAQHWNLLTDLAPDQLTYAAA